MHKKRTLKLRRLNIILWPGIISGVALLAIGVLCLNPAPLENPAHATTYCMGPDGYVECDTSSSINTYARIAPVVSIGLQSDVVMDVTPKASGVFTEESVNLTIATNSSEGYSLYMRTLDDTNALTSIKKDDPTTIKAMEGEVEADALATQGNVWGYKLNASSGVTHDDLYRAVPATSSEQAIHVTDTKPITGTDSLDLTFGVHVDTSLPSGTYRNSVLISAVANPVSITNLSELVFMQDMTSSICSNTAYDEDGATTPEEADPLKPVTKQLIDTRDGKKYWVAKLKDGNCWMTQNLALNITESMAEAEGNQGLLNSATTDIGYDNNGQLIDGIKYWNKSSAYPPTPTDKWKPWETQSGKTDKVESTNSWGKYQNALSAMPTINSLCKRPTDTDPYQYNSVPYGADMEASCSYIGYINVPEPEWSPTFKATLGNYSGINPNNDKEVNYTNVLLAADLDNKTYDSHYLVGIYYAYNAATAGTGVGITNDNAADSICPKGWKLPRSGNIETVPSTLNTASGTYYYLLSQYGLQGGITATVNGETYHISSEPLNFFRAGHIIPGGDSIRGLGSNGYFTSATAGNTAAARYDLKVVTLVNPSGTDNSRQRALTVRCLAR